MEAQGGQTDKAENGRGAQGAFQPVTAVGLERLPDQRQAGEEEAADGGGAGGQGMSGGWVRFLQKFAEYLGKDTRIGNGDGQYPGERAQAGNL